MQHFEGAAKICSLVGSKDGELVPKSLLYMAAMNGLLTGSLPTKKVRAPFNTMWMIQNSKLFTSWS